MKDKENGRVGSMGKIFYLIGKSAVGKDTILEELLQNESLCLNPIVQYTTRPIREGEENGREYNFITDETASKLQEDGKVIEMRAYHTVYGVWKYMMVDDGETDLANADYAAVGTVESYERARDYYGESRVIPIYIDLDTGERLQRALDRERKHDQPKYTEMCRRFLADEEDFSYEHLQAAGLLKKDGEILNRVENNDFGKCLQDIAGIIQNERTEC